MLLVAGYLWILGVAGWMTGAIYFDVGKRLGHRSLLVGLWIASVGVLLFGSPSVAFSITAISTALACFLLWWFRQQPSHEGNWDPDFARLPQLTLVEDPPGRSLVVKNLRNSEYSGTGKSDVRYEVAEFPSDQVTAVDALIVFWGSQWICHPMAIFEFENQRHLCFSIEVRYREGEEYAVLPSLYRQHELMYVVSTERDAILRRVVYHNTVDCYLYRLQVSPAFAQQLLSEYIAATNRIADHPKWYNVITSNCTTEIFSNRREKTPWDWRMLINGQFDRMLYDRGLLASDRPFETLKSQSQINQRALQAGREDFSRSIRTGLPGF
ncbi:MAG: DUF4105 domain-containing protein [Pirellulaceae bacterium]